MVAYSSWSCREAGGPTLVRRHLKALISNNVTIARGLEPDRPDRRLSFPVDRAAVAWNLIQTKAEPVLGVILDWNVSG